MTMNQGAIKRRIGDFTVHYRHSDYKKRKQASRNSGPGRDLFSGTFSGIMVAFNFVTAIVGILIISIVLAGWVRFVAVGKVSNRTYWKRLTYDAVRIGEPNSRLRLKRFAKGVLQNSESAATLF